MLAALREKVRDRRAARAERQAEKLADDYGHLSEREKHEVETLREEHQARGVIADPTPERDLGSRPGT